MHIGFSLLAGIAAFTAPSRCPDGPTNPQEYTATYIQVSGRAACPVSSKRPLLLGLTHEELPVSWCFADVQHAAAINQSALLRISHAAYNSADIPCCRALFTGSGSGCPP